MGTIEELEVLDSITRVLDRINDKLDDENVLGNILETDRLKRKKIWVEKQIQEWKGYVNI